MTHDEAMELLAVEALDALAGSEREALIEHLSACVECERELAPLRDVTGALAYEALFAPFPPIRGTRIRARLLARAAADVRTRSGPRVVDMRPARRPAVQRLSVILAAAVVLLSVGLAMQLYRASRANAAGTARIASLEAAVTALRDSIGQREQLIGALLGPRVRVIELASAGVRAPEGRMFWDQASDSWTFVAHDLPRTALGRAYQLWLITPGQRTLSAGVFTPGDDGNARVLAQYPLPADSLAAVAVTEEPATGVPSPTGRTVLVGQANR